jgi:hypothetical protein
MASYGLLLWGRARQLRPSLVRDPTGIPRSDRRAAPLSHWGYPKLAWMVEFMEDPLKYHPKLMVYNFIMEDPMKMDDLGLLFQESSIFLKSWGTQ